MSKLRLSERIALLAIIAIMGGLLLSMGCKETPKPSTATPTPSPVAKNGEYFFQDVPVAKIGDTDLMLSQLLDNSSAFMVLDQGLIGPEILTLEAKKRGIYPTPDEIDKAYQQFMMAQGGEEGIAQRIPPFLPKKLAMEDLKKQVIGQLLQQKLVEDQYAKEHPKMTDAEIKKVWDENGTVLKNTIAQKLGVPAEQVTEDMAMTEIESRFKQEWMAQNNKKAIDDIRASYVIKNYLADQFSVAAPEEVVVPELPLSTGKPEGTPPAGK